MIMQVCPQLKELLMKGGIVPHSISNEVRVSFQLQIYALQNLYRSKQACKRLKGPMLVPSKIMY